MSEQTKGQGVELTLKEKMQQREDDFGVVVETYVKMVGVWLSATSPAISQAVSALTIGFATFEGIQSYFHAPWYFAIIIGAVAAWAAESIGFTAVDERDHIVEHNQRTNDPARHLDIDGANRRVNATFYATVAIVLVGEVVPSGWGLIAGTSSVPGFLFRCSLLLWPIVSRIGAQLYAARSVRVAAELEAKQVSTDEAAKLAEAERKAQLRRDLDAEDERTRKQREFEAKQLQDQREFELKLKLQEAEALAKIERERVKVEAKLAAPKPAKQMESNGKQSAGESGKLPLDERKMMERMISIYQSNPSLSTRKVADELGTSHTTVGKLLSNLLSNGVLHSEGEGRNRKVSVNGNHEAFLAGKI